MGYTIKKSGGGDKEKYSFLPFWQPMVEVIFPRKAAVQLDSSSRSMTAAREIPAITNYARFNYGDLRPFLSGAEDMYSCRNEFLVGTVSRVTSNPEKCPLRNYGAYWCLNPALIINTFAPPTFPRFLPLFWQQIWQPPWRYCASYLLLGSGNKMYYFDEAWDQIMAQTRRACMGSLQTEPTNLGNQTNFDGLFSSICDVCKKVNCALFVTAQWL